MATIGNLLWYALPLSLAVLVLFTGRFAAWLKRVAARCEVQGHFIDLYYRNASKFLKLTDANRDAEMREMVTWIGHHMMEPVLIRTLLLRRISKKRNGDTKTVQEDLEFDRLSDEAKHSFGQSVGAALLVSSYQSIVMGEQYRAMLDLLIEPKDKEVKEPQMMVQRFKSARSLEDHKHRFAA